MVWQFSFYSFLMFFSVGLASLVLRAVWLRRHTPGALALFGVLVAAAVWCTAAGIESGVTTVRAKIFWSVIAYFGTHSMPTFFLLFCLDYTQQSSWIPRHRRPWLTIIPALTILAAATNGWHHLIWTSFTPAPFNGMIYGHGAWFWLSVVYSYLVLSVGTLALIRALIRFPALYRRQTAALILSTAIPFASNAAYVFGLNPLPGFDLTPFSFSLTAMCLAWALTRFQLLDLAPVARETLIERLHDAVIVLDQQERIVDINPAARQMFGMIGAAGETAAVTPIGRPFEQAFSAWPALVAALGQPAPGSQELLLSLRATDAEPAAAPGPRCLDLQAIELRDRRGRVNGRLLTLRDITARRQADQELANTKTLLEAAIEQTPIPLALVSAPDGVVRIANSASRTFLDMRQGESFRGHSILTEQPPWQLLDDAGNEIAPAEAPLALALQGQAIHNREYRVRTANGHTRWALVSAAPIHNRAGETIAAFAAFPDVTPLKQTSAALGQARDAAEAANRAKSAFLANMSHEIRTPLNAVIGMANLLVGTPLNDEQREMAAVVQASGEALLAIIDEILDFSKIEAGNLELEEQPFSLVECIEEAFDLLATTAAARKIELAYLTTANIPTHIIGDKTRLRQVLLNLIGNAIKFTERGEVTVLADGQPAGERLRLQINVRDTGIGIPLDRQDRLFQAFSQIDASTTRRFGGTGLGLAISQRLCQLMQGGISVQSEPGVGSTFTASILAAVPPGEAPSTARDERLAGKRILIVSSSAALRSFLQDQTTWWGMEAVTLESRAATLAYLAGQPTAASAAGAFAAALLDLRLSDGDGLQLAHMLRALDPPLACPFVILAPMVDSYIVHAVSGLAQTTYLPKPVKFTRLRTLLTTLIGRGGALAPPSAASPAQPRDETYSRLRVLLAEDNLVNQKVARFILDRLGIKADLAMNGVQVLEAALHKSYDLILMDVQMPEMDGLEATQRLRQMSLPGGQPMIVAMTASVLREDRDACLAAGMDGFVGKPATPGQIIAILQKLQEKAG